MRFRLIFSLTYIISNVLCAVYFYCTGSLGGDLKGAPIMDDYTLLLATIASISSVVFICFMVFPVCEKIVSIKSIPSSSGSFPHILILTLNILSLFAGMKYGFGVAGASVDSSLPFLMKFILILFQPNYLSLIYFFYYSNERGKWYFLNLLLFISFTVSKGWLGYLVYLGGLFLFVVFKEGKCGIDEFNKNQNKKLVFYIIIIILISPALKITKNAVMIYFNEANHTNITQVYIDIKDSKSESLTGLYLNYLFQTIERFQHVSNLYFVHQSRDELGNELERGEIKMFYHEGWVQDYMISQLLGSKNAEDIQTVIAQKIDNRYSWKSQIGLFGWLLIDGLYFPILLIYVLFLIGITIFLSKLCDLSGSVVQLTWLISSVLIIHGWFYDYVLYIQALLVWCSCILAINFFPRKSSNDR